MDRDSKARARAYRWEVSNALMNVTAHAGQNNPARRLPRRILAAMGLDEKGAKRIARMSLTDIARLKGWL